MSGSSGFEKGDHYDVSMKAGERVLLPAVREASKDTLILTDGFSCREQIAQGTDRRALHLAQAVYMGMHTVRNGWSWDYPEAAYDEVWVEATTAGREVAVVAGAALLTGAIMPIWKFTRGR